MQGDEVESQLNGNHEVRCWRNRAAAQNKVAGTGGARFAALSVSGSWSINFGWSHVGLALLYILTSQPLLHIRSSHSHETLLVLLAPAVVGFF